MYYFQLPIVGQHLGEEAGEDVEVTDGEDVEVDHVTQAVNNYDGGGGDRL
jgi:hypothetical protein